MTADCSVSAGLTLYNSVFQRIGAATHKALVSMLVLKPFTLEAKS